MLSSLSKLNSNVYGILWAIAAGLLFSLMMALIKLLGSRFPSIEIVFFRALVQSLVLAVVLFRIGFSSLKTRRPVLMGLRALIAVVLINFNFYAFAKMPLADVTAIGFSRNLFLVLLAVFLLGERPNGNRIGVTIVGFIGILVIIRPGSGVFGGVAWIALAGACLGAVMMTLVRKLTATESNAAMMTYHSIAILAAVCIPAAILWVTPTFGELCMLLSMSVLGILGQWCMIQAFRRGEATVVAPANYFRLISAAIIGFYIFAEVPDRYTILGAVLIVGSNLFLIMQESRIKKPAALENVPGDPP